MGFILIPNIGVSNINIGVKLDLVVMSILIRKKERKKVHKYNYINDMCNANINFIRKMDFENK